MRGSGCTGSEEARDGRGRGVRGREGRGSGCRPPSVTSLVLLNARAQFFSVARAPKRDGADQPHRRGRKHPRPRSRRGGARAHQRQHRRHSLAGRGERRKETSARAIERDAKKRWDEGETYARRRRPHASFSVPPLGPAQLLLSVEADSRTVYASFSLQRGESRHGEDTAPFREPKAQPTSATPSSSLFRRRSLLRRVSGLRHRSP